MFLAELAYNTVAKEIEELEKKQTRRQQVLDARAQELDKDNSDLLTFIQEENKTKMKKEELEKKHLENKKEREDKLKQIESQISSIKSDIDKNKDLLDNHEKYQEFVLKIAKEYNP